MTGFSEYHRARGKNAVFLLLLILPALLSSCSKQNNPPTLRIAEQYGLAYAPLQLMRLEKKLETAGIRPEWVKLMNTASIREAMLAGRVDIGFMGIPPFLLGRDNGMDWKIFTGLCRAPLGLVSRKEELHSLKDLSDKDRIALPQPGSIQHILLSMAAEKELGDSSRFDSRLITLSHPDGYAALSSGGDIAAHYTSPPYLFEELKLPGARLLTDGESAFGSPFTFIVGVSRGGMQEEDLLLLDRFTRILKECMDSFESDMDDTVNHLSSEYAIPDTLLAEYLSAEDLIYSTEILGLDHFQEFMHASGLLKTPPVQTKDLILEQNRSSIR